jgi:hypothetical protein
MRRIKIIGLAAVAVLALTAFMGLSSASAAQWLDNGSAIGAAENSSIVDNGSGLTLSHTGGLFGARSLKCSGSAPGTVGAGSADTSGTVTVTGCTNVNNCTSPGAVDHDACIDDGGQHHRGHRRKRGVERQL